VRMEASHTCSRARTPPSCVFVIEIRLRDNLIGAGPPADDRRSKIGAIYFGDWAPDPCTARGTSCAGVRTTKI
jgi:hypothetical protein